MVSDEVKREVLAAIEKWKPRLYLHQWSLEVLWDTDREKGTRIFQNSVYKRAALHIPSGFPSLDTDEDMPLAYFTVDKGILHELCHLFIGPVARASNDALSDKGIKGAIGDEIVEAVDRPTEQETEHLARVIWEAYEHTAWDAMPEVACRQREWKDAVGVPQNGTFIAGNEPAFK